MFIGLESSGVAHSFRSAMLVEDLLFFPNARADLLFLRRVARGTLHS